MIWLLYLVSLTEPKLSTVATISTDSVYFYHKEYQKKKIIHQRESVYVFDGGYMYVGGKFLVIEFFNGEKVKYKIRKQIHEYYKPNQHEKH